mmetsp:Transcript_22824/g.38146  ORF Transcript_22824/g.38146 Transcript_22824/m.38146 type:complete len:191 (-) Transcript_22824:92-664(-)
MHSRWCIYLVSVLVLICIALLFSTHYTKYTLPTILSTNVTSVHKLIVRPSGLRFFDLIIGVGDSPVNGEKVSVHYVHYYAAPGENVTTENYGVLGKEYDSTRALGRDAFEFTLGLRRVPKGMSEAVKSMKVGGRRIAIVPPELGYGDRRVGVVVPHATLIYDLELLEVAGLDRKLMETTEDSLDEDSDEV